MFKYIFRRVLETIPVLLISSIIVFMIVHLIPGDVAVVRAGPEAPDEVIEAIREQFGLNEPIHVQYMIWLGNVLQGDFGNSYINDRPVAGQIAARIPATLQLALGGMFITLIFGIVMGVVGALSEGSFIDLIITTFNSIMIAIPNFWVGILAILLFSLWLGWLPPGGRVDFSRSGELAIKSLILPSFALAINASAILSRFTRTAVLETLHEDFVRTARAKGLSSQRIIWVHVMRNALIPIVTIIGILFGRMLSGAIIIEAVFSWPGMGRLLVQSISNRDYNIVQAILLLTVCVFIVVNLCVDILYGILDPRIRISDNRGR